MIKVISPPQKQAKTVKCDNCKAILEYTSKDCLIAKELDHICQLTNVMEYIWCPCCKEVIPLNRYFYYWSNSNGC